MSEEPIRNDALLRKVGDTIAQEPERYNQSDWAAEGACGTVACVAGHAVLQDPDASQGVIEGDTLISQDGQVSAVEDVARDLLGLEGHEAWDLFAGSWKPAGWTPEMGDAEVAALVRDALYRLADGATVAEVTEYRE